MFAKSLPEVRVTKLNQRNQASKRADIVVKGDGADLALLKLVGLVKDGFGED